MSGRADANAALGRRWLAAFNAHDLEGLLALYADDCVHLSPKLRVQQPETKGEVRGKAALREWWRGALERLPGLRYVERTVTASDERVFLEYLRQVPGEAELPVAEVFDVRDGRIQASRVYHG